VSNPRINGVKRKTGFWSKSKPQNLIIFLLVLLFTCRSISYGGGPAIWGSSGGGPAARILTSTFSLNDLGFLGMSLSAPTTRSAPAGTMIIKYSATPGLYMNFGNEASPQWASFLPNSYGTSYLVDGGNSFSQDIQIGTNDSNDVTIETAGTDRLYVNANGQTAVGIEPSIGANAEALFQVQTSSDGTAPTKALGTALSLTGSSGSFETQIGSANNVYASHSAGTYDTVYGTFSNVFVDGNGNITNAYGLAFSADKFGTGYIQNASGIRASVNRVAGAIRTAYGIEISTIQATGSDVGETHTAAGLYLGTGITASGGTTNNKYSILSDSTNNSQFAGPMIFMDTAAVAAGDAGDVVLTAKGASSQTAHLFDATDSSNNVVSYVDANGNVGVNKVGSGFAVKEGSNAKMGQATLVGGTSTVSTTAVTSNSRIFLTCNGSSAGYGALAVTTITANTSFVITSTNGADTCPVSWLIVEAL
jgi:hypothetical protein